MRTSLFKQKKILIGTSNSGKFREIKSLLDPFLIESISVAEFNLTPPEETALTFEENSLIKAKYYANKTGNITLADDSGLCIDILNGYPGVHSARFALDAGGKSDFETAFEKLHLMIKDQNKSGSETGPITASFVCSLSLFDPTSSESVCFTGKVAGEIIFPPRGKNGFGYDPIFIPKGFNQTLGELESKQKDKISHRSIAFAKLTKWLNHY